MLLKEIQSSGGGKITKRIVIQQLTDKTKHCMMMSPGQGWYLVRQIIHSNKQIGLFSGGEQYWLLRLAKQEIHLLGKKTLLCRSLRMATKLGVRAVKCSRALWEAERVPRREHGRDEPSPPGCDHCDCPGRWLSPRQGVRGQPSVRVCKHLQGT